MKSLTTRSLALLALLLLWGSVQAQETQAEPDSGGAKKPNILVIWGDDVGMWNISAYHRGMMGGTTPNIDLWVPKIRTH
jgi:hypothetical protein